MHRFRSIWLALMGGAVIVTLSLSVALGADPADETDGNRGQTISGFVHSLIFTQDDPADDETVDEDQDEDEDTDEDTEEDADEADEGDEDTEADADSREVPEEFANHGECVSEAAHDTEGFDESDAANKGEWVSDHARYTCWGLDVPDEEAADDEAALDEDAESELTSAEARAAAKAERAEARAAARAARAEAREAAEAARTEVRAAGHTNRGNGGGHGKP
jgi:hypothetical protein